jgi:hypothetical protein
MGLFDFYTGNTTNNDGLNLIYSKENGDLLYAFNKKNGKIDGLLQIFHSVRSSGQNPNYIKTNVGLVKQEYFFIDGLPNGYFKEFDSKGNLSYYIENIKSNSFNFSSKFSIYFLNTKLLFSDKYQINGVIKSFLDDSFKEYKIQENKLISEKEFFNNGNLKYDKNKKIRYYENGILHHDLNEGKIYYETGVLKCDLKEGKEYYKNGNIKIDIPSGKNYFKSNNYNINFFDQSYLFSFEDALFNTRNKKYNNYPYNGFLGNFYEYFKEIYFYDEKGMLISKDEIINKFLKMAYL